MSVHENEPARGGADPAEANAAVVLTHGRGATARSILAMSREFPRDDVAYAAPQATNNTWYPHSFLEPVEKNEPGRTAGLAAIDRLVEGFVDAGIDCDRILLLGFSQGACLTTEYAATHPTEYGGVAAPRSERATARQILSTPPTEGPGWDLWLRHPWGHVLFRL